MDSERNFSLSLLLEEGGCDWTQGELLLEKPATKLLRDSGVSQEAQSTQAKSSGVLTPQLCQEYLSS